MKREVLFLAAVAVPMCLAQSSGKSITLAGTDLQLGMSKESALAKLAVAPNSRLRDHGNDSFVVLTEGRSGWHSVGDVIFRQGTLSRICLYLGPQDREAPASALVSAMYDAIKPKNHEPSPDVWATFDDGPIPPVKEIHVAFTDREVVVYTSGAGDAVITNVSVFFPRMLRQSSEPK